ncbi:MAG: hypothetical protein QUS35_02315 [bacterium]|nr:hypothetical protein [bacterium]
MKSRLKTSRILMWTGLILMLIGAVDPLEGSVVIVIGAALALTGACHEKSSQRKTLAWAFGLVAFGVAVMFGVSAVGGFGGSTGRSMWWALTILPYPVGWVLGLIGAVKALREKQNGSPLARG